MKSIKNLFFAGLIALAAAITFAGCENPAGGDNGNGGETYTVTFDAGRGSPATKTLTVAKNALVGAEMPKDPVKDESVFGGWHTRADGGVSFTAATPVNENITVYARWLADIAIPKDKQNLAAALAWISANAVNWGAYTVTLTADENISEQSLSYNGKRASITLKSDGTARKVALIDDRDDDRDQVSLFVVRRGVTLTVKNLTLNGWGNNNDGNANKSALVQVNSGGVLKLKTGAVITGNYNADDSGGAIRVNQNAELIMEGGEIKDNTAREGGGVDVRGTFAMKGGTINGNEAEHGGGVRVDRDAIFTMNDGEISGNTASDAGGVRVGDTQPSP